MQAVADATGLCRATIYQAVAEAQLGSPGHFSYRQSALFFTVAGLCQLVQAIDRMGYTGEAKALAEAIRQRRQAAASAEGVTTPDGVRELARRWDLRAEARAEEVAA